MTVDSSSILDKIVSHKKIEIEASKQEVAPSVLEAKLTDAEKTRPFKEAISKKPHCRD